MEPVKVTVPSCIIAGVSSTTSNAQEAEYEEAKIPKLWREYFQSAVLFPIANEVEDTPPYAIYHNYQDGVNGEFDVTIGAQISTTDGLDKNYKTVTIEETEYLRFDAKGEMPMIVVETWQNIWRYFGKEGAPKRAFKTDFEIYPAEDEVSIYISIA